MKVGHAKTKHLWQLQKIVHDIKKNDGGLMQKIKKITKQAPPSVPKRDYVPGTTEEEEEWSDEFGSDYESPDEHSDTDNYVVPSEDQDDDNYEPPPNAVDHNLPPSSFTFVERSGGYADKQANRQLPSIPVEHRNQLTRPLRKPNEVCPKPPQSHVNNRMPTSNKPLSKPLQKPIISPRHQPVLLPPSVFKKPVSPPEDECEDEENYIMPEDDNYIEPTQNPPVRQAYKPPTVNRGTKPTSRTPVKPTSHQPSDPNGPELYEVPEHEKKPSPPPLRVAVPRRNSPPKVEPEETYEVCENDMKPEVQSKPSPPVPSPLPRNIKPKPPQQKQNTLPKDMNSNNELSTVLQRPRIQSAGAEAPTPFCTPKLPSPILKPNVISVQKPPEVINRYVVSPSRHGSVVEQEAGVLNKDWYTSTYDRKAAEEALHAMSKDGSFLVRKSTGQDSNQPFTLVVLFNRKVYNIPVRYIESSRQYALGREKSGEEKFSSVAEMIENHQRNPLVLIDSQNNNKNFTKLKHAFKTS